MDDVEYGELATANQSEDEVLNMATELSTFHNFLDSMTYILIQQRRVI